MTNLPIAAIGAGPVGLAAAAQLVSRRPNATPSRAWRAGRSHDRRLAHVRVFSPAEYNVDVEARWLLLQSGWTAHEPDHLPTGAELIRD